jgi:hypothetical protein
MKQIHTSPIRYNRIPDMELWGATCDGCPYVGWGRTEEEARASLMRTLNDTGELTPMEPLLRKSRKEIALDAIVLGLIFIALAVLGTGIVLVLVNSSNG